MQLPQLACFVATVIALVALARGQPATAFYYNAPVFGNSSQYDTWSPGGGCGFIDNPASGYTNIAYTAGIGTQNFYQGEVCGMCIKVINVVTPNTNPFPATPFITLINNLGPVPTDNWLDFSNNPSVGGNWYLEWQAVDCPGMDTTPVKWQVEQHSHQYYVQLIPVYSRINIAQMCIFIGGAWTPMSRVPNDNGLWFYNGGPNPTPQVKAISVDGQVIVDTISITLSDTELAATAIYDGMTPSQFGPVNLPITQGIPDCNTPPTNGTGVHSPSSSSGGNRLLASFFSGLSKLVYYE